MKLTTMEALKYLEDNGRKMHINTMYSHIKAKRIKATRTMIGGRLAFDTEELDRFIQGLPAVESKR